MGSISVQYWSQIAVIGPIILVGIIVAQFFAFHLNAFSLGEKQAAYLGINVEREKLLLLALASMLTACAVSLSGLIGLDARNVPDAFTPDALLWNVGAGLLVPIFQGGRLQSEQREGDEGAAYRDLLFRADG